MANVVILERVQGRSRTALSRLLWNRCPCYDRSREIVRQSWPKRRVSPTAGEANKTNHVRRIQEQGMVAVALCRAARHRVPPLLSSCMQYRTFLISEYCSHEFLICTVDVCSFLCTSDREFGFGKLTHLWGSRKVTLCEVCCKHTRLTRHGCFMVMYCITSMESMFTDYACPVSQPEPRIPLLRR